MLKWYRYIKALFRQAISQQPAIIFIDEIDGLARSRSSTDTASTNAIKSSFLKYWSELDRYAQKVVVIGTSSIPEQIDPAFVCRFGLKLRLRGPEEKERAMILADEVKNHMYTSVDPSDLLGNFGPLSKYVTGAQIKDAMANLKTEVMTELYQTQEWVKVST